MAIHYRKLLQVGGKTNRSYAVVLPVSWLRELEERGISTVNWRLETIDGSLVISPAEATRHGATDRPVPEPAVS